MIPSLAAVFAYWLFQGIGVLASFVTSSSVFPKPLEPEEEQELLARKNKETKVRATS